MEKRSSHPPWYQLHKYCFIKLSASVQGDGFPNVAKVPDCWLWWSRRCRAAGITSPSCAVSASVVRAPLNSRSWPNICPKDMCLFIWIQISPIGTPVAFSPAKQWGINNDDTWFSQDVLVVDFSVLLLVFFSEARERDGEGRNFVANPRRCLQRGLQIG